MKKVLLSLMFILSLGLLSKLQAQCELSISNVSYEVVGDPVPAGTGKCKYVINAQFDLTYNSGSKFVYFHLFKVEDYPTATNNPDLKGPGSGQATSYEASLFGCQFGSSNNRNAPDRDQLGQARDQAGESFLDLGLDNSSGHGAIGVAVPVTVLTTYPGDAAVELTSPLNSLGLTVTKTFLGGSTDRFVIQNLEVIINQAVCGDIIDVVAAGWASNAAGGTNAQCYFCGLPQAFNDPTVEGEKNCSNPRTYDLDITTGNAIPKNVVYRVYIDIVNFGSIQDNGIPGFQNDGTEDYLAFTSDSIAVSSGSPFSIDNATYAPGSGLYPENDLIVRLSGNTLKNSIDAALRDLACTPLPVKFSAFTATRSTASSVAITWTTAQEENSKGFYIQKNVAGVWTNVAYVPSQSLNGTSSSALNYSYVDMNSDKGITQYRIQQVDLDGKFAYTDIRAIRGEGTVGKVILYPNPSSDGKVNVVFEDNTAIRDVQVNDMQGKVVRNFKGVSNNILTIEKLTTGFYTIKVINRTTNASSVHKVVIK